MLGRGQYAFDEYRDENSSSDIPITPANVPIMIFGADEFCQAKFGVAANELYTRVKNARAEELAAALDSVLIGDERARQLFDIAAQFFTKDEMETARQQWHDKRRSSLNDIGARAWAMARRLRGEGVPVMPAPQQIFVQ